MKTLITCLLLLLTFNSFTQSVAINNDGSNPNSSAILDVKSNNKGILVPRLSTTEMNNISTPADGLLIFNTTTNKFYYCHGGTWSTVSEAAIPLPLIEDQDSDTHIAVDDGSDYDMIRFTVEGNTIARFEDNGLYLTQGNSNSFVGFKAGEQNNTVTAKRNTYFGYLTGNKNVGGAENTGIGYNALLNNTSSNNVAIGSRALEKNTLGAANVGIGRYALSENLAGGTNVGIGHSAMRYKTGGSGNTAVGNTVLENNGNGFFNTAIGFSAGEENTSGSNNTIIGYEVGENNTGSDNTLIGFRAGQNNTGSKNVFIGYQAGQNISGSNKLVIDNEDLTNPLIYGEFDNNLFQINGQLKIGNYSFPTTTSSANNVLKTNASGNLIWDVDTDTDETNELQNITRSGTNVFLSQSGGTVSIADNDNSSTNELINSFFISNDQLTVTDNGGNKSVDLSEYVNHWTQFPSNSLTYDDGPVSVGAQVTLGDFRAKARTGDITEVYLTGNGLSDDVRLYMTESDNGSHGMYFQYDGGDDRLYLYGKVNSTIYGSHMSIQRTNGKVSFGEVFDQDARVSVDGFVSCEELKVEDSGDWPDFVFQPEYQLSSLSQLEKFIETNGHLPGIPSAQEVNGNGIKTGAMIEKLLLKIEELTLYTIQQQKQIDNLKVEYSNLKSK